MAETSNVLRVNIVTPDGLVYDHHARMLVVHSVAGELGIMANHEPIVTPLEIGEVDVQRVDASDLNDSIAVNGGFMEVSENVASIVADSAERERDIDLSRAQAARDRAQKRIAQAKNDHNQDDLRRAQVALRRAINRINVKTSH
ncbi:F0F1 ATP synthase subunit epsilon [Lacticaseibacillus paracasei]